jgi:hypothetical protein
VKSVVKVLYVLGIYRSGTTILSNLLGQLDGFCSVGELRATWRELRDPAGLCGCGELLASCPFWVEVLETAFGSVSAATEQSISMKRWQDEVLGQTHTWTRLPSVLLRKRLDISSSDPLSRYGATLARLYQAVAEVSRAEVIVDSSKEATDAALVGLLPGVEATFVQIVRDPRGVVNSSLRRQPDGMDTLSSWRHSAYTAMSWTAGNLAGAAVRRNGGAASTMLLRYEDFTAAPVGTLQNIAELMGVQSRVRAEGDTVAVSPPHTVAGNENRFEAGPVRIQQDVQWRTSLHRLNRATVTALCSPLIARYRYPLR